MIGRRQRQVRARSGEPCQTLSNEAISLAGDWTSREHRAMTDKHGRAKKSGARPHLYFAYGSNLDQAQMRQRCPTARKVGVGRLDRYRLGFAGWSARWGGAVATVLRDPEASTPGLVWALSGEDLKRLDRFEGHPVVYRRRTLWVDLGEPRKQRVQVYVKQAIDPELPSERYFGVVLRAYVRYGFPTDGLATAIGVR